MRLNAVQGVLPDLAGQDGPIARPEPAHHDDRLTIITVSLSESVSRHSVGVILPPLLAVPDFMKVEKSGRPFMLLDFWYFLVIFRLLVLARVASPGCARIVTWVNGAKPPMP